MSNPMQRTILEGENLNVIWKSVDEFVMQTGASDVTFDLPDGPARQCILLMADEFRRERERLMEALYEVEDQARKPDELISDNCSWVIIDDPLLKNGAEEFRKAEAHQAKELAKVFSAPMELFNA